MQEGGKVNIVIFFSRSIQPLTPNPSFLKSPSLLDDGIAAQVDINNVGWYKPSPSRTTDDSIRGCRYTCWDLTKNLQH